MPSQIKACVVLFCLQSIQYLLNLLSIYLVRNSLSSLGCGSVDVFLKFNYLIDRWYSGVYDLILGSALILFSLTGYAGATTGNTLSDSFVSAAMSVSILSTASFNFPLFNPARSAPFVFLILESYLLSDLVL